MCKALGSSLSSLKKKKKKKSGNNIRLWPLVEFATGQRHHGRVVNCCRYVLFELGRKERKKEGRKEKEKKRKKKKQIAHLKVLSMVQTDC
jgi:hypothetical protein